MFTIGDSIHVTDGTFEFNSGSLYALQSKLTFSGFTKLENFAEPSNEAAGFEESCGAITSVFFTVIFTGVSSLSNNQARRGGAILATKSRLDTDGSSIMMYGETIIANNTATNSSGGGIFFFKGVLLTLKATV